MREVAGAGQVERDAGRLGRRDDLLVAHRAARLHDGRTPASSSTCSPSANGKNASDAATEPAARSPARATASRAESTRLTWPMPTPTVARSCASRIALDFTARTARQAKTRSSRPAASRGSPVASVQLVGSSPGASSGPLLQEQPAADRPQLRAGAPGRCGRRSSRMFFFAGQHPTASSV